MRYTATTVADSSSSDRHHDIRRLLVERRRAVLREIQTRVKDVRELGGSTHHHTADLRETIEADPEDDLVFALIQMQAETLARIDEAVHHLDEGTYGSCLECGEAIASSRLRAMPFAVRCRDCEAAREQEQQRRHTQSQRAPSRLAARY